MKILLITLMAMIVIALTFDSVYAPHVPQHPPPPPPQPCTGNPQPDAVSRLSAEMIGVDIVRLEWDVSTCATEFAIERQSYVSGNPVGFGTIFTADRDFQREFIDPADNKLVWFFLDPNKILGAQYDYRILAKTQTKESRFPNGTLQYSPEIHVDIPRGVGLTMVSEARIVGDTGFFNIVQIDYQEGSSSLWDLIFKSTHRFWDLFQENVVSLFMGKAFAVHTNMTVWQFPANAQNEAKLFFIQPMPAPPFSFNSPCSNTLIVLWNNNETNNQVTDFTLTLLDYPTIIHSESFVAELVTRHHIALFHLNDTERSNILDYGNIFVQINAQAQPSDPSEYNSLIIKRIAFLVPENQNVC